MSTKPITPGPAAAQPAASSRKRRSTSTDDVHVRYFLLKPGSSLEKPELGEEIKGLKQVLVRSFRTNQPFLTVTAWNAIEDTGDSGDAPKIVKEVVRP